VTIDAISDAIMKSIALVLVTFLLAHASVAQPGTRKLKVIAEDPLYTWLAPRDCTCENVKGRLCDCWCDFDQLDQPAVVGRTSCVLRYASALKTDLLAPFEVDCSHDGQVYVRIPAPGHGIKRFLELFGASELFQVLKPSEIVDAVQFLRFVAQGKWVIADKDERAEDTRVYHMYLHDLNNHLLLWWLLPPKLRTLVQERTQALDDLFCKLRTRLSSVQFAVDYIQVLNCLAGFMIDVKMGNLNVKVLHFSGEMEKTTNELELMLNVCLTKKCERKQSMFYVFNLPPNQFALEWIFVYQKWLLDNFRDFFETGEFDEEEKLSKDEATDAALKRLKHIGLAAIEELAAVVCQAIKDISDGQEVPEEYALEAHSFEEEFSKPVEEKLKKALEFQSESVKLMNESEDPSHGLNVRALLANPTIPAENANAIGDALLADLMRLDGSGV